MNPYDFVHVDWNSPPQRRPAKLHHHFDGLSGRIEGTLTALTPLFLPAKLPNGLPLQGMNGATLFSQNQAYQNANNPRGYFIAGSSLKGLLRSVVETVAQGCFWFCADQNHLSNSFKQCSSPNALCAACRLFGLIKGRTLRLGNIGFEDVRCTYSEQHDAIYTAILSAPKPRHTAFYLSSNQVAGRKFYFHHNATNLLTATGWLPPNAQAGRRQNQFIQPLGDGSNFTFASEFVNVDDDDFAALLYAISLQEGMRHKFGYAKPCGLGSVHIQITKLIIRDPAARYRQNGGETEYQDAALTTELNRRVAPFIATIPAITRADLQRIWQWPPAPGVTYRYPTQAQFAAHPNDPISTTDTW